MISGLDGLRGIAFLILFGLHADYLQFGWMGVQLFFVLSGFLITGILVRMKETLSAHAYFTKFYIRRFLRIFPLYYFFLLLMLGLAAWMISISYRANIVEVLKGQAVYAFLYMYDFYSAYRGFIPSRFFDHLWSLSVEEQFYLVWPLLVFLTPKHALKKLFLAGIFFGPLFRFAFSLAYQAGLSAYVREPLSLALYPLPFSHVDAFAFGAYISCFSIPQARKQMFALGVMLPVLGFTTQYLATGQMGALSSLGYPVTMPNAYQYLWAYTLINYWFALLIQNVVHGKLFTRFLSLPFLTYLGKISYGLYVYHFPILWFAGRLRDIPLFESLTHLQVVLLSLAFTILVATVSFYWLEKPLINLKDKLASY